MSALGLAFRHLDEELDSFSILEMCIREGAGRKSEFQVTREKSMQRTTKVSMSFVDHLKTLAKKKRKPINPTSPFQFDKNKIIIDILCFSLPFSQNNMSWTSFHLFLSYHNM